MIKLWGSFNKLKQTGSIESYIDCFEDLRASMLEFNPALMETHFLHSFISGLQDEIKHTVMMFKPQSLDNVYELAENKEKKMEAQRRKNSYNRNSNQFNRISHPKPFKRSNVLTKPATDQKPSKPNREFKKGECFKCGEKWAPGNQCKTCTLHLIEEELPEEEEDSEEEEIIAEPSLEEGEIDGEVTLNAINCHTPPIILKLTAGPKRDGGTSVN